MSDAYYCKECTIQEKDVRGDSCASKLTVHFSLCLSHFSCAYSQRDGCPKIVNLGSSKTDLFYERKKYGFKKR